MAERSRPGMVPPPEPAGPFASPWRRRHLTVDERVARGLAARHEAPRSSHGRWEPAPDRPDPVALLEEQAASRVPGLVPIRHGRMLASAFTFYRGAALIMAADLAATPVSGVTVQLCGDAHLSNFGLFGTPERQMLFDINDFDETLPGPWEWDVKRLAASFEIMGRDRGFSPDDRRAVVMAGVQEYRSRMRRAAGMRSLDAWYEHFEIGMLLKLVRKEVRVKRVGTSEARAIEEMAAKARTRDSTRVFAKRAEEVEGELRIVAGQRLMQAATDIFLGWQRIRGMDGETRDYYVRQFHDWKGSADVETLLVPGAALYARICGATLARAHARWGDRIAIASYLGKGETFDRAMADFSAAYADQNERDYAAFAAAVDSGRLAARTGV